jgi:hypothetical protein
MALAVLSAKCKQQKQLYHVCRRPTVARLPQQLQHLARLGVAPKLRLLEHRHTVAENLESSAFGRDQFHLSVR